jgi:hypothetical protein
MPCGRSGPRRTSLPPGAILGIGRTKAYELARDGAFPVTVIRVGRRYLVPVAPLLALLGTPSH